jgi:hypothetical protein
MGSEAAVIPTGPTSEIATMAKPATVAQPTFSLEALKQIIDQPEARAMLASLLRETGKEAAKADVTEQMDGLVRKAFRKTFGEVKPRVDTKTYNLWLRDGLRVREGEKSIKVKSLRLFHRSQCEPMTASEKKEALAALDAKAAKRTADRLPAVSPVEVPKKAKGKGAAAQATV